MCLYTSLYIKIFQKIYSNLIFSGADTEGSGGIESINGNGSNYDSGAFSRTSSPAEEIEGPARPPPRLAASTLRKFMKYLKTENTENTENTGIL